MTEPSRGAAHPLEPEGEYLAALTEACARFARDQVASLASQPAADVVGARALAGTGFPRVPPG